MHVCIVCPEMFRRYGDLKKHLRARHSLEMENQYPRMPRRPGRPGRAPPAPRTPPTGREASEGPAADEALVLIGLHQDTVERTPARPLRGHLVTHSGDNSQSPPHHQCAKCPQKFSRLESLVAHYLVHSAERPRYHQCTECPSEFISLKDLKAHLRVHFIEKPHQCPECPRSFLYHSELKKHFRSHTGERPYQCTVCLRSYAALSGLRAHFTSRNSKCREERRLRSEEDQTEEHDEDDKSDQAALDLRIDSKMFNPQVPFCN